MMNTRTGIRFAVGIGAVGPLLLSGAATVFASPETEPPADGTYLVQLSDGQTETWTITASCGPGCTVVQSSNGWTKNAQFFGGGYWGANVFGLNVDGPAAATCPDGTTSIWKENYSFSSPTLTGKRSLTKSPSCAGHQDS